MAIDLSGMFRNLGSATEGLSESVMGPALPADPLQRNAMQRMGVTNPLLQQFGQGLGSVLGKEMRSPVDQGKNIFGDAMTSDFKGKYEAAQKLMSLGLQEQGIAMFKLAEGEKKAYEEKLALQKKRESLVARLRSVGLNEQAQAVADGADMDEAFKSLKDQEKILAQGRGDRKSRAALARQMGNEQLAKDVLEGKYDNTSKEAFNAELDGLTADLKAFQHPTDGILELPVNSLAQVRDPADGKWKYPSDMGLTSAPQVQKVFNAGNKVLQGLIDEGVKNLSQVVKDATQASKTLVVLDRADALLSQGINSGTLANVQTGMGKVAMLFGFSGGDAAATEQFVINQLSMMGAIINEYGAGTGISNFDVQNAMKRIAADPTLAEQTIRNLIRDYKETARYAIDLYDKTKTSLLKDPNLDQGEVQSAFNMMQLPASRSETGGTGTPKQDLRSKYGL